MDQFKPDYARKGYIKDIYIELPYYRYQHGPVEIDDKKGDVRFLGREKIKNRLLNTLKNGKRSGAYLVTGYRGMGKTSFVNQVIKEYLTFNPDTKTISLCLNQDKLETRDVYQQVLSSLRSNLSPAGKTASTSITRFTLTAVLTTLGFFFFLFRNVSAWKAAFSFENWSLDFVLGSVFIITLVAIVIHQAYEYLRSSFNSRIRLLTRIDTILERINGEIIQESGTQGAGNKFPLGFVSKKTNRFLSATTKEVESEVIDIIEEFRLVLKSDVIFIFDELDKVEFSFGEKPSISSNPIGQDSSFETIYQKSRKDLIVDILAGLKHFITRAPAKFIFIAGREMFDAALADINDRQSSLSSIFHQIINVDSFLRDKTYKNTKGITNLIEEYLRETLLPEKNYKRVLTKVGADRSSFFKTYYQLLYNFDEEVRMKVIFALQNLLIYLTYRSNGSPHKLNALIEELIVNKARKARWKYVEISKNDLRYAEYLPPRSTADKDRLFLKLSYSNQYRHSFISYLYRPFILTYSRYLKEFSDMVLYSTPYLMDHLIKFHPFAFSKESLELLPEIVSSNRQPSIRFFAEELISFFRQSLLREIELGLFEYKYFKKVINEIEYISKTFETEAAAFNFTQDENFKIKLQIKKRIRSLRDVYKDFVTKSKEENIFSVSYLNVLLGDAHFFDHEFNEATIVYQDAIHYLNLMPDRYQSIEVFILLLKVKLKIGLAFEKIKSYDLALSHYSEAVMLSKKFFYHWGSAYEEKQGSDHKSYSTPSYFDELLQLCLQSFLAKLYLQEKLGAEGATINKVMYLQRAFLELLAISRKITKKRNKIAFASFNLNVGTLFFFKNAQYLEASLHRFYTKKELAVVDHYRQELNQWLGINYSSKSQLLNYSPYAYISYCTCLTNLLNSKALPLAELLDLASSVIRDGAEQNEEVKNRYVFSRIELKLIATILTKIGDVILSYLPTKKVRENGSSTYHTTADVFDVDLNQMGEVNDSSISMVRQQLLDFSNVENILSVPLLIKTFNLSAEYYRKAEISVSSSFQFRKIFHVIRLVVRVQEGDDNGTFFRLLERLFLSRVLYITSWNSSSSDRPQIDKYKYYFGEEGFFHSPRLSKFIYKNISNSPEIKEALLFYASISIRGWEYPDFSAVESVHAFDEKVFQACKPYFREQSLVTLNGSISSQFTRILELSFLETINQQFLKNFVIEALVKQQVSLLSDWPNALYFAYKNNPPKKRQALLKQRFEDSFLAGDENLELKKLVLTRYGQLIVSSIFCLTEIIRVIHICGVKYMLSYSYLATFHRRLGEWLKHFILATELSKAGLVEYSVVESLNGIIGPDAVRTLDPTSQFQLSLQNYRRAIQLHSQGKTYHHQIGGMSFLEDDFNDNLYHYCAAIERQQINSGRFIEYMDGLTSEIDKSQLLKVDRYMNND